MNKPLTVEEQLMLLAYGAIPSISKFVENHPDLPDPLRMRATYVFFWARTVVEQKKRDQFMRQRVDQIFSAPGMREFFDSLISSDSNDRRDLKLITKLVKSFHKFTDVGMEAYADFVPFTSFAHSHWLELMVRIQKSNFLDPELEKAAELFISKGFSLILHPELNEFGADALKFFAWFEKLEYHEGDKLVSSALKVWKKYEKSGLYNISDDDDPEKSWYQAALEFSIQITSKEYVSKVFAESFKTDYPEVYEKFKLLVELDDYEIIVNTETAAEKKNTELQEVQELLKRYELAVDSLVEIVYQDTRVGSLALAFFMISTNVSDRRNKFIEEALTLLIENHADCELVKELTSLFTKNLEEKIAINSLDYSDLPPSPLYISNEDWHWLF